MKIAVVNSGSSSLKCKLIEMPSGRVLAQKLVEHIGEKDSSVANHQQALEHLDIDFSQVDAVGHRVVHGGEKFCQAVIVDKKVTQTIQELISLAPLHNPANLQGIEAMQSKLPHIPHVAVFDTAFHTTLPQEAYTYALPYELYENNHIRRYGFHGTSHEYLAQEAAKKLQKPLKQTNLITLHLGNGASVCAIQNGNSIDTSMGFTPLEGLVMGSRCGDIDPSIVLYLQRELGMSVDEVDKLLNKNSGLLGMCGSNDVREILEREDTQAQLAIEIMVRRIQKYIGAYYVLLEGKVDALIFSGGIGENSQSIREHIKSNRVVENLKSFVIKTDEEFAIAKKVYAVVNETSK